MPVCVSCSRGIFTFGPYIGRYVICRKCGREYHHRCAETFAHLHQYSRWVPVCRSCSPEIFSSEERKVKSHL